PHDASSGVLRHLVYNPGNARPTMQMYTLSLHDALPISGMMEQWPTFALAWFGGAGGGAPDPIFGRPLNFYLFTLPALDLMAGWVDRKSTRLNSSHQIISYAVFFLIITVMVQLSLNFILH